jgi:hypothetical protein
MRENIYRFYVEKISKNGTIWSEKSSRIRKINPSSQSFKERLEN